jgi:hypothetical protein
MEACMAETKPTRTIAERMRTDVLGPSTRESHDAAGVVIPENFYGNSKGSTHRAGAAPPENLKWYLGQGGITGTRSGTPTATHEPNEPRLPDQAPPSSWDPGSTKDIDAVRPPRTGRP